MGKVGEEMAKELGFDGNDCAQAGILVIQLLEISVLKLGFLSFNCWKQLCLSWYSRHSIVVNDCFKAGFLVIQLLEMIVPNLAFSSFNCWK